MNKEINIDLSKYDSVFDAVYDLRMLDEQTNKDEEKENTNE